MLWLIVRGVNFAGNTDQLLNAFHPQGGKIIGSTRKLDTDSTVPNRRTNIRREITAKALRCVALNKPLTDIAGGYRLGRFSLPYGISRI